MKTDKSKIWENKFFEGEELTPEEELFLKNESENPYFSSVKEMKKDELNISFDDFLQKVEEPKVIALPRKTFIQKYWLAASLVMIMGLGGIWMIDQPEKVDVHFANQKKVIDNDNNQNGKIDNNNEENDPVVNKENIAKVSDNKTDLKSSDKIVEHHKSSKKTDLIQDVNFSTGNSDYNPNYVLINGKPVYSEQEAIALTEDAFNYFASNVTQTINQAENAQNVSKDLYQIINY